MAIRDAWVEHDELALAGLTPAQRQAQCDARRELFDFVDDYREAAKEHAEQAV
jgi:t-SNARE complex subunit (syntaxin)